MNTLNEDTERYLAVIDLGTCKTALAVARVLGDNIQILFYRTAPSAGMRNSAVLNIAKVEKVVRSLVSEAENELKIKILQVAVGLPRCDVQQRMASGEFPRANADDCITEDEIRMLKEMAMDDSKLDKPETEMIYGAVAQSFATPEYIQLSENDIVGMVSPSFTGNFKIFIGKRSSVNSLYKVFDDLGIAIVRTYFSPIAAARAVLTDEELQNGVALIDLGAGATSIAIYIDRILAHYSSIPFGGDVVTSDIRSECTISDRLAENIKKAFGGCLPDKLQTLGDKIIQVETDSSNISNQIPVRYLSQIITAREQEILDAMLYFIQESGLSEYLRKGVVITGGGAEMLHIGNFLRDMSGYTVRTGYPKGGFVATGCEGILSTEAVCTAGMVLMAKEDNLNCCLALPAEENAGETAEVKEEVEEPAADTVAAEEAAEVPAGNEGDGEPEAEEKEEEKHDEEKKDGDAGDREKKKSGDGLLSKVRWSFAKMFNDMNNETV